MKGTLLLLALVAVSACDHSATAPTNANPRVPAPPTTASSPIVGVWNVQYQITENCCDTGFHTPLPLPYAAASAVFRFSQVVNSISGTAFGVDVSGTIGATTDVVLTGTRAPASAFDSQTDVTVTLRPSATGENFSGTFAYTTSHRFDIGPIARPDLKTAGIIASASPTVLDSSVSSFTGTWAGTAVNESCVPATDLSCEPARLGSVPMTLTLTQTGTDIAGTFRDIGSSAGTLTVSGAVNGGVLTLTGSAALEPPNAGAVYANLLSFSATRDALGRMSGSFSYSNELRSSGDVMFHRTYEARIVSALLSPN